MKVENKVAIITGASSGFGSALAWRISGKGGKVVLADVVEAAGGKLEKEINKKYGDNTALFVKCDVASVSDTKNLIQKTLDKFQRFEIMINNAGIGEKVNFNEDINDNWFKVVEIDLIGVILGTRFAITHFINTKTKGVILNTASLAGLYPQPLQPVYAAAKGGVVHFTRSLANLNDMHGIRVNAICPSFSPTPLIKSGSAAEMLQGVPLVSVDQVVDAFMLAIEDDSVYGKSIRITPQLGIDFYEFRKSKSSL
ncbi:hypothetical protein HK099_004639 [Clydaea vesicula]|uniref:Uncharacterized protein n=1 Tax=Clydaea vesicula TaxID=447962 RepID=A0AAD5U2T2_9FUNG|nr:hypothetical protein HK099_004639 [Clydaea vesicula]